MKYVNRDLKGTFGYIKSQRNFEIIKTLILFIMAFGLYLIGYITLKTNKSLWSIFAVLAMLPACKSLVGVIMLARFKSLVRDDYDFFIKSAGNISCLYENVITTEKKSFFLPCIACENNTIITYCERKDTRDNKELHEHLVYVLKNAGFKNVTVKIFDNKEQFINRLCEMNNNLSLEDRKASTEGIFNTIKAVSL